jgi:hypothetical protein
MVLMPLPCAVVKDVTLFETGLTRKDNAQDVEDGVVYCRVSGRVSCMRH